MKALVDVFGRADESIVTNAVAASQFLTPLAQCSDFKWLTSRGQLAADPTVRAKVQALASQVGELNSTPLMARHLVEVNAWLDAHPTR
jgi:hypothetical protein